MGAAMNLDQVRDQIYEAAMLPDRWPGVLDAVAGIAGAVGSILIDDDRRRPVWTNSASLDGFLEEFMAGEWGRVDTRMPKLIAADHAGFLLLEDVYSQEELASDPMIQGFLKPRGYGWATATFVPQANGSNVVISVERRFVDGPVPREAVRKLDAIRGDLARAARLSSNLGLDRGRSTVDTLGQLGFPAGVVGRSGRLQVINNQLRPLMPQIVRDTRERIAFAEPRADAQLAELLNSNWKRLPTRIAIRRTEGNPPYVASFLPVTGAVRDVFAGGFAIMVLEPVITRQGVDAAILKPLFDLTDAEASVLSHLSHGDAPGDVAKRNAVSKETVRTHMKALFNKTGVNRQAALMRLVAGIAAQS